MTVSGGSPRPGDARRVPPAILLDLGMLGRNPKGVGRVLAELAPRLLALAPDRYRAACTRAALPLLPSDLDRSRLTVLPAVSQSLWEQVVLPAAATRVRAGAIYSHQECGALWGPPLLLHIPEDPEVRWSREPVTGPRDRARRYYSRTLMDRAMRRARIVTSTQATLDDLHHHHGIPLASGTVVPLGVDLAAFRPPDHPTGDPPYFFHLASSDPRDRTDLIVEGFALFASRHRRAATLVVAGRLGEREPELRSLVRHHRLDGAVTFRGTVSDAELVALYGGSAASVHASPDEGFGLQPLEAMACGALLISTPARAVAEVAREAEVLWAQPDAASMAGALERAWGDGELRERARTVNRRRASEYSWDRTAGALHQLLASLAADHVGDAR